MAQQSWAHGFFDAAATAFLAQRMHRRRERAAVVRERIGTTLDTSITRPAGLEPRLPPLSIVVMAVGSRGDVQPFVPIGRRLAQRHRVRIATHREFRPMVEEAGLEFYPLAGDPHELMEYMARTGGRLIPTRLDRIVEDVPRKRALIADILASTWRACTEADPDRPQAPAFRADVILANPPSYGHIHCAEALQIPLHMIFTMPWSPTGAYPHPFAGIDPGRHHPVQNLLSYGVVDLLVWSGIGDLVNAFRQDTLNLPPIALVDGASLLEDHEVPFTYLWPDTLVPKPSDWDAHIELANFIFHDQAHTYQPPGALLDFLAAGEAPIYVGFGSVRVENPAAVTRTIVTALEQAGARGIVAEGWAHLGGATPTTNVLLIGDCPHDWLFPRCRAVCHHGGAGTVAAGLRAGLPTVVVPTFGDQFFWGQTIATAGAGPEPISIASLDSAALAAAFAKCREPQMRERARALGAALRETDGVELVVQSVYRHLPRQVMSCASDPDHLATVCCDTCRIRLCPGCGAAHSGHLVHPAGYVDWGARPDRGVVEELGGLVGDAAKALHTALDELIARMA